jgi:hypothetical protein
VLNSPRWTCVLVVCLFAAAAAAQRNVSTSPQPPASHADSSATIIGTVVDTNGGAVSGAAVVLKNAASGDSQTATVHDNGSFSFNHLQPGAYSVVVSADGFAAWSSDNIELSSGQFLILNGVQLKVATVVTTVTALTPEQIATEQVHAEETQRAFGFIPNFYVAYDPHTAPMTAKLKFHLAFRTLLDPVTLGGFVGNATIYQAGHYPDYREGWAGYGQRLGSTFAGGYTNVLVSEALLPSLLHQDPRYFYRGTGTAKSRLLHALAFPVITRGDNGHTEFNYSGIGGDLASGAIANAYYPSDQRGARLVLNSALIGAGGRIANGLVQEFVLPRFTSRSK